MPTADEIVSQVVSELGTEKGRKTAQAVIGHLGRVHEFASMRERRSLPRLRSEVVFFATAGKLPKGILDVRVRGRLVGEVRLKDTGQRMFRPVTGWADELERSET